MFPAEPLLLVLDEPTSAIDPGRYAKMFRKQQEAYEE